MRFGVFGLHKVGTGKFENRNNGRGVNMGPAAQIDEIATLIDLNMSKMAEIN